MSDAGTFAPYGLAERAGMACARCRQFTLLACLVNRNHWPEGGERFCPGFDLRDGACAKKTGPRTIPAQNIPSA